jgi:hypothetical protein
MESIYDLSPEIRKRIGGVVKELDEGEFSRPGVKNVERMLYGMMKSPGVYVTGLARTLGEKIAPKKTWERLSRNLRREGLGKRLLEAQALKNRAEIRRK